MDLRCGVPHAAEGGGGAELKHRFDLQPVVRAHPVVRLDVARRERDAGVCEEPAQDLQHGSAAGQPELVDEAAVADAQLQRA